MSRFGRRLVLSKLVAASLVITISDVVVWARLKGHQRSTSVASQSVAALGQSVLDSSEALGRLLAGVGTTELSRDERQKRLQTIVEQVQAMNDALPRDTFDVASVAAEVGADPSDLHRWVREHTRLVPYRGSLRGGAGVLMDRVGNSLDRALLLSDLLQSSGHTVRLARATLTVAQVRTLPRTPSGAKKAEAPLSLSEQFNASIDAYAQSIRADASRIREQVQSLSVQAVDVATKLRQRVNTQTARLAKAVAMATPKAGADPFADEREALRDHWWVQIEDGGGWNNLDPCLDAGKTVAIAQETRSLDALDPSLHHTVTVRIIVERRAGAKLEEQPVIDIELRASEVMGQVLRLYHAPTAWPRDLIEAAATQPERVRAEALQLREWLPVLRIGGRRVSGPSVLDTGELNSQPGSVRAAARSELTAEWIEYEIKAAGRPTRTIRREVFDLIGPAARAARSTLAPLSDAQRLSRVLSMLGESEILVLASQLSAPFVEHLMAQRILANAPVLDTLLGEPGLPPQDLAQRLKDVEPLPGALHALATARTAPADGTDIVYLSQPNIISRHAFLRQDASGALRFADALDIVINEVSATHAAEAARIAARMEHGVMDSSLEAFVLGDASVQNTPDSYAGDQANSWITLRRTEDLAALSVTPDIRARIEADIRAGYVVVAPAVVARATGAGWWRVDPSTGDTLSKGDRGWGQSIAEYLLPAATVGVAVGCMLGFYAVTGVSSGPQGMFCTVMGGTTLGAGSVVTGVVFQSGLIIAGGAVAFIFFAVLAIAIAVMIL